MAALEMVEILMNFINKSLGYFQQKGGHSHRKCTLTFAILIYTFECLNYWLLFLYFVYLYFNNFICIEYVNSPYLIYFLRIYTFRNFPFHIAFLFDLFFYYFSLKFWELIFDISSFWSGNYNNLMFYISFFIFFNIFFIIIFYFKAYTFSF